MSYQYQCPAYEASPHDRAAGLLARSGPVADVEHDSHSCNSDVVGLDQQGQGQNAGTMSTMGSVRNYHGMWWVITSPPEGKISNLKLFKYLFQIWFLMWAVDVCAEVARFDACHVSHPVRVSRLSCWRAFAFIAFMHRLHAWADAHWRLPRLPSDCVPAPEPLPVPAPVWHVSVPVRRGAVADACLGLA